MRFFFDNNVGPDLSKGLRGFGEDADHLQDHFNQDVEDVVWLERIGKEGWYLITRDHAIRRKPAEIEALRRHKVGAFFLGGKKLGRCDLIEQVVRNWRKIKELATRHRAPFAFRIPPRGRKIERIF